MQVRSATTVAILVVSVLTSHCAKPKAISRTLKGPASAAEAKPESAPMVQGVEVALTGLPDFCSASPAKTDGQVCVSCNRAAHESGPMVEFKDLCFPAKPTFDPRLHCSYAKDEPRIKAVSCKTLSDEDAFFDLTIASELAIEIMPVVLMAIKAEIAEKLKDDPASAKVAEEALQFISDRLLLVLNGKEIEKSADDLVLLVSLVAAQPAPDATKDTLRDVFRKKLEALHIGLVSKKALNLAEVLSTLTSFSGEIPDEQLGKAKTLLTRAEIVSMLEKRRAELDPLVTKYSAALGVDSLDKLLSQWTE